MIKGYASGFYSFSETSAGVPVSDGVFEIMGKQNQWNGKKRVIYFDGNIRAGNGMGNAEHKNKCMIIGAMIQLYSYGAIFSLGVLLSLYYFWKMGKDEHLEEISLFDAYFLSLAAYFAVGRVIYAYLVRELTIMQSMAILSYPGLNELAGIGGAVLMMVIVSMVKEWNRWKIMDLSSVSLSLILAFGGLARLTSAISPTNIFSLVFFLVMFVVTYRVRKNFRFYSWYKGEKGVPPEGLAAKVLVMMAGLYFLLGGLAQAELNFYMVFVGVIFIFAGAISIFISSGRKIIFPSVK